MNNKIICAVIGKNIAEIGNGASETYYKNIALKLAITDNATKLIEDGVSDFMVNAEYGFPLWAAEILLGLRDIRLQQGLPAFRLHIVMPHEEQAADWSDDVHERFYIVHAKADEVLILYRQYHDKCHENCERFMIDNCHILLTDGDKTFAAQYAKIHQKRVLVCDSLSRL